MTRVLPQPQFQRWISRGPDIFVVEFSRPDGKLITALWSKRPVQYVNIELPEDTVTVNAWGEQSATREGRMKVSEEPFFLVSRSPLVMKD